jgi:acetyl-CoA synthetase
LQVRCIRRWSRPRPATRAEHDTARSATATLKIARDFLLAHREDYAGARRGFRWPRLERFNFAFDWFDDIARERDHEALRVVHQDGTVVSRRYSDLASRSNQLANYLRSLGVRRGDAVLLMLGNVVPLWESILAITRLGALMIPASPLLSGADLQDRLERGAVRAVIAAASYADRFPPGAWIGVAVGADVPGWQRFDDAAGADARFVPDGPTAAGDPLILYFTSGTTSKPKLVLHSHVSYPVGHLSTMYWIGLRPGDVHLNISSPGWAKHAWSCLFAPWLAEATVLALDHARFDAAATLEVMRRERVTTFCAPPTVWRLLIQQDLEAWKSESLRELVGAGEPLNPEVIARVRNAWGITIRDGFGQTESSVMIANTPGQVVVPGAVGRPLPGFEVSLLDAEGNPATEGEISISLGSARPVGLMQGYRIDDRIQPITGPFYRTGDVAACDANGVYTYVGRTDDVFKSSDYRISPFELESVLIEHPLVAEAAVVPSPDPLRLSVPKAFIALVPGAAPDGETARSIFAHARRILGPFKRIRRLEFYELPKTISGKIRRVELRRLEAQRRAADQRGALEWVEEEANATDAAS